MTEPGPTRFIWPFTNASTVPSLMMIISSSGCLCGGCDVSPGFSVVTWHSSSSSVAVWERKNVRTAPVFVVFTSTSFHSNMAESITFTFEEAKMAVSVKHVARIATVISLFVIISIRKIRMNIVRRHPFSYFTLKKF